MPHETTIKELFAAEPERDPVWDQAERPPIVLLTLEELYIALPANIVVQVVTTGNFRRVQCRNRYISGVIHTGGRIVPVINLLDALQGSVTPQPPPEHVAILRIGSEHLAIPIVEAFYSRDYDAIPSANLTPTGVSTESIQTRGRLYQLLDARSLLTIVAEAAS